MSLITLLLGIFSTVAPLIGISVPEPEPAAAVLPVHELVLEPCEERELDAREEERMMAAIQYRCEWVGLRGVQVRRDGRRFLVRVESGLIKSMEEYTETLDRLESVLNERTSMQLLRVHPDADTLVMDGELQEMLEEYEVSMVAYEESGGEDAQPPAVPQLPRHLRVPDFMLAESAVVSAEDGSAHYEYLVVQRPEVAAEDEMLVTEQDVDRASLNSQRPSVDFTLTPRGAETLTRLTRSMKLGKDRLAILLNGVVVSAPVVHAELGGQFFISGLSVEQCQSVADSLVMPLPVKVRVISRRRAE
ncbi:MAG: hypothetical protein IKW48_08970 [Akkermansia sp.]|nr:hypothetical protein [Akkermansia sp.]